MREKEIERILVHGIKDLGGVAFKFVSPGNDGVPDRLIVIPDRREVMPDEVHTARLPKALHYVYS
jgi:hypothetical protein